MAELLETVNRFRVRCGACQHFYQTAIIDGLMKLLHAKVDVEHPDRGALPTKECRLLYDFVRFDPCNHCCPEVFELCPEPHKSAAGRPTRENCAG
jgi:hypothetical protein